MTVEVKICGLSTPETLDAAVEAGASHVGFVHYEPSPRHLTLDAAAALRARVPQGVKAVLLLANADPATTGMAIEAVRPDVVQFHGKETPEWVALVRQQTGLTVWRAVGLRDRATLAKSERFVGSVDRLLFDAPAKGLPGGNGVIFPWQVLEGYEHKVDWVLAGGLTPDNVAQAIRETGATLVDTSSGVESAPGVKDVGLIRAFCAAALTAPAS